jgi:hypothetical protein
MSRQYTRALPQTLVGALSQAGALAVFAVAAS